MPFIILGAGLPHHGEKHSALRHTSSSVRVLDWVLQSTQSLQPKYWFVSGYQADEVKQRYPEFSYCHNSEWEETNAAWSLLLALKNVPAQSCFAAYSDILFRPSVVRQLAQNTQADIVVAVDTLWRKRYVGRSAEDIARSEKVCLVKSSGAVTLLGTKVDDVLASAEFVGLVKFSEHAVLTLQNWFSDSEQHEFLRKAKLSQLIERLRSMGFSVSAVDVEGNWAQLNEDEDLSRFVLGTKAQTLSRLRSMVKLSRIEDQVSFTVAHWQAEQQQIMQQIATKFDGIDLVARSSALSEDGFSSSNAGVYTSVLNINGRDSSKIVEAIETVIASYPDGDPANEVLVQPMLKNVLASGVVFTRSLGSGAPYYVANYDESGSTESITDGTSKEHKTLVIRRDASADSQNIPPLMSELLPALREIEGMLGYSSLDVEFAITEDFGLHILQVRPIAVDHSGWQENEHDFYLLLKKAEKQFSDLQTPAPFVLGNKGLFGIMPDWNPAEIIGTKPSVLATSLYRELILNDVWATQRTEYGYRDVRPQPLLTSFAGHPYIDIRASFNSFIPATLRSELAERLVNFALEWLEKHPQLHDKVEFEVIPTCYDLNFNRWRERFVANNAFTSEEVDEIEQSYLVLTQNAFSKNAKPLEDIATLVARLDVISESDINSLQKAFCLLDDAKQYGTLAFSHLARSGFVAVILLRSALETGLIQQNEYDAFFSTVKTVSQQFTMDAQNCASGVLSWEAFVKHYGHLRPGTYDILSPSYHQDVEHYMRPIVESAKAAPKHAEVNSANEQKALWDGALQRITEALLAKGFAITAEELDNFMREAVEGREYAKFEFTRNLSAALDEFTLWANSNKVDLNTLNQVDVSLLRSLSSGGFAVHDINAFLVAQAALATQLHNQVQSVELPPLITSQEDFAVFVYPATQANYIGSNAITAECVDLSHDESQEVAGKIVLIPQADPGYDWLFGRDIAGLITMYGGANSHMAIRSAEFGLPAAIGIGEAHYKRLAQAQELELSPANRTIREIR